MTRKPYPSDLTDGQWAELAPLLPPSKPGPSQKKHDAFVLGFSNDTDTIQTAYSDYHRTTVQEEETDPDRFHDLKADLDGDHV